MELNTYFADLHIHIGRDLNNKPVKITGSKSLTLTQILIEASERKGIDIIGVIDCHVPAVQGELEQLIDAHQAFPLKDGGIQFENVTLILGVELEIYDHNCQGPIHVLCYFPTLAKMQLFTKWLKNQLKNINLSSQRVYVAGKELQTKVKQLDGLFIPAHVFTPFKSLYGRGVRFSLREVFRPELIDGIELGLSSDSYMAASITEINCYPFLSNSDAHSLGKIGREYQQLLLQAKTFNELKLALKGEEGRAIIANYGMHPQLGKYYQSVCKYCGEPSATQTKCATCQSSQIIKGVRERIDELANNQAKIMRPPYYYHVPLEYVNGIGKVTYNKLIQSFGTEMNVYHNVEYKQLAQVVGQELAQRLIRIRKGDLIIKEGGGGLYGRLIPE
ncbi:TIGR00375 family protein [Amphibacillus marinus]|uniref:TIGR00375 family protein n=1 Tax=Amphibacillus marinus TaxID=872970 RepID=A0A1H8GBQ3_9BACI|nr:endonuclease Q family protein [Amphibacillus marinus]SEN40738.1 TIGR00375 family protein [Amphibacillus marinus]